MSVQQDFWKTQQEQLQHKLATFEECLETPFVPGELDNWLGDARDALEALLPQLQLQTQHIHAEEYAKITQEDPEMYNHVELMQAEDQSLLAIAATIADRLDLFLREKARGATETALKDDLDQLVEFGLKFVTRIRKQEVTVRTWLVEAFNRDRGTVD